MAAQYSEALRNAQLDQIEAIIGTQPMLRVRTGAPPANCAAADAGTVLAEIILPVDWLLPASAGSKLSSATWTDLTANAAGTAAHFRIYNNAGTVCHLQGTATITGGGGDMQIDNPVLAAGQEFRVVSFQVNAGNA